VLKSFYIVKLCQVFIPLLLMDNHDIPQFLPPPSNDGITGYKYWSFPAPGIILTLRNEDQRRDKNQKKSTFSQTQQVWTTRCTLLLLWCGSKFNNNLGKLESGIMQVCVS